MNGEYYTLRRSGRAKRYSMSVRSDGRVVLTAPMRAPKGGIEEFAKRISPWVVRKLLRLKEFKSFPEGTGSKAHYERHKEEARELITERVRHFNHSYGLPVERISIRNQRSRWGSCSKRGTLCFNYRIMFLPPELCDYVVVHEICHLKEFNHSSRFWALVALALPDHRALRRSLLGYRVG